MAEVYSQKNVSFMKHERRIRNKKELLGQAYIKNGFPSERLKMARDTYLRFPKQIIFVQAA
jgi:hypothetical protein